MFNLLPGSGLGFSGSKEIAFGLGAMEARVVPVPESEYPWGYWPSEDLTILDNSYSIGSDDDECILILSIMLPRVLK